MGFMDKAKKLAEQAQQKLDEAQTQFNQNASPQSQPDAGTPPGDGVRYDEHGRPLEQPDPAAPQAEVAPDAPKPDPNAPQSDANATPDPFKPLQ